MNILKIGFIILFGIISFSSCEKDDICVEGNTPLLIIRFYDAADTTKFKPVSGLRIVGVGKELPVNTFADRSSDLDSIGIPLKVDNTTTGFTFILNSANDDDGVETGNSDTVDFNYETNEVYKSRACGFIVNYDQLAFGFTPKPENWIQRIEIIKPSIEIEETTTAHVKIFH